MRGPAANGFCWFFNYFQVEEPTTAEALVGRLQFYPTQFTIYSVDQVYLVRSRSAALGDYLLVEVINTNGLVPGYTWLASLFMALMRLAAFNALRAFLCPVCAFVRSMGMLPELFIGMCDYTYCIGTRRIWWRQPNLERGCHQRSLSVHGLALALDARSLVYQLFMVAGNQRNRQIHWCP